MSKPSSAPYPGPSAEPGVTPQCPLLPRGHLHRVVMEGQPNRVLGGDSWTGVQSICCERQVKDGQASFLPLLVSRVSRMR